MKKLVLLFVTIMFLVAFTLIGCNQSTPAPEQGATGAIGAPGAPGAPAPAPATPEPGATGVLGAPGAPAAAE